MCKRRGCRRNDLLFLFGTFVAKQTVRPPQRFGINEAGGLSANMPGVIGEGRGMRVRRDSGGGGCALQDLLYDLSKGRSDWVG